jgi:hypothetical protein
MRVLGLLAAGVLALSAPVAAHAVPLGWNMGPARMGPTPGIVKAWGGCGWGWHPVPGHWSPWRGGWVPPHCAPDNPGGWPPYGGWGGPYPGYGGWGAAWAPYGGWQGAYGGWVNP